MPTITRLQLGRRRKDRVNVHLDDEFAFSLAVDLAASLRSGQEMSTSELAELRAEDDYRRGLDDSLRFLAFRPRSRAEVRRYLVGRDVHDEHVERVLARLCDLDLVDDEAFARWWVDNRTTHRPRGKQALRHELFDRGVDRAVVSAAVANVDEETLARAVALDKAPRYAGLERPLFFRRLGGLLARRGFGGSAAHSALNEAWRTVAESQPDG